MMQAGQLAGSTQGATDAQSAVWSANVAVAQLAALRHGSLHAVGLLVLGKPKEQNSLEISVFVSFRQVLAA